MADDAQEFMNMAAAADNGAAGTEEAGAAGAAPGEAPQDAKPSTADELAGMLAVTVKLAARKFPSIVNVWTDATIRDVAGVLAPVLDKYDLDIFAFLERWRAEIMAVITCLPLAYATAAAIRDDLEREAAAKAKPVTPTAAPEPSGEVPRA